MKITLRLLLTSLIAIAITAIADLQPDASAPLHPEVAGDTDWYDAVEIGVHAKGWSETPTPYTRLPVKAKATVPNPVWSLSHHSAGLFVRFRTDANLIKASHTVTSQHLAMPHMTAVGTSGLDLYAYDPQQSQWRWAGFSKPTAPCYTNTILDGISKQMRDYTLYLPLYNGTKSLKIGVPVGSSFERITPPTAKPIVYYGTSIAHGCSASRPGMAYTAILGRRLNRTIINLGFSGNGKMELELADLLAEIDASLYVLDCVPNMSEQLVKERAEPFVRRLRAARPDTPIIMVNGRPMANSWIKPDHNKGKANAYHAAYRKLWDSGITSLFYISGDNIFGDDDEGTIDRSHPTDLGMWRQAEVLTPVMKTALENQP